MAGTNNPCSISSAPHHKISSPLYRPLAAQQNTLGWEQLWNGRWALRWVTSLLGDKPWSRAKRLKWIRASRLEIDRYLHNCWKERALLTAEDKHQLHKESLLSQIESLYSRKRQFPTGRPMGPGVTSCQDFARDGWRGHEKTKFKRKYKYRQVQIQWKNFKSGKK